MRFVKLTGAAALVAVVLLPGLARAQSVAGTVRDSSGGVLPGATIEVASDVLIEKVRTAVSDSTGQYQILGLPPGVYKVTFSLPGFNNFVRDAVEVSGGGVMTLNAEMRVGGVQETITVTGETPVVDVRSARRETVLNDEIVATLPASRGVGNILSAVPGIITNQFNSGRDPRMTFFSARGGNGNEGTVQIDGMNVGAVFNGGGTSEFGYDTAAAQEIQVTIGGATGEADRGGPSMNLIPKSGGNTFSGTAFGSWAGEWSQGSNLDDRLRAAPFNFKDPATIYKMWDLSLAEGGPIFRDRLWFFGTLRSRGVQTLVPTLYANLNQGNASAWNYVPNEAIKGRDTNSKKIGQFRLTGQVTPRNKVSVFMDYQAACEDGALTKGGGCLEPGDDWIALGAIGGFGSASPEAGTNWDDREKIVQANWNSPMTNRLLLEAGYSALNSKWGGQIPHGALTDFIPVTEILSNATTRTPVGLFTYRGVGTSPTLDQMHNSYRASASYVTGAHNIKLGYQGAFLLHRQWNNGYGPHIAYTFFGGGPTSATIRSTQAQSNRTMFNAVYAQDSWTIDRLTLSGALRFDRAVSWAVAGENRIHASPFNPTAVVFPRTDGVTGYNDISPRLGAAYDVFGTGKTSVRVNWGKYLRAANNEDVYITRNPANTYRFSTTVNWQDLDGDRAVDCDLTQLTTPTHTGQTDVCGDWNSRDFNSPFSVTTVDPAVLSGWGTRQFDRQFNISVQQEVLPRVSVELGYARRTWDNIFFTQNRSLVSPFTTPGLHYDIINFPIPQDSRLPDAGKTVQYQIITQTGQNQFPSNFFTVAPAEDLYYWQGIDFNFNARLANGLTVQGGTATGKGRQDYCEVWKRFPNLVGNNRLDACDVDEPWNTNLRMLAAYTVPKVDVLVSFIGRSTLNASAGVGFGGFGSNGGSLAANYTVPAATISQYLPNGRALANNAATQVLNLTKQGQVYGPRVNSYDFRFAKILRFGGSRATVGIDLYNAFNSNNATGFSTTFNPSTPGEYLRPTALLDPRFLRFNLTYDF